MFSILDVGVDAVIFSTGSMNEVREALVYLGSKSFDLSTAKIIDIQEVGDGGIVVCGFGPDPLEASQRKISATLREKSRPCIINPQRQIVLDRSETGTKNY